MKLSLRTLIRALPDLHTCFGGGVTLALAAGLAGCAGSGPSEPQLEFVNPQLAQLVISETRIVDGAFAVQAAPLDTSYVIPDNGRLIVDVTTARGEAEDLVLRPTHCNNLREPCTTFGLKTKRPFRPVDLLPQIRDLPALLLWQAVSTPEIGTIELLSHSPLTAADAAWKVRTWSEVESAEVGTVGGITVVWYRGPRQGISGLGRVEFAEPIPHDDVLQFLEGDVVVATYYQPDGAPLTREVVVSCEDPPSGQIRPPVVPVCR